MKRHGNLYEKICSLDNLILADHIASLGKSKQYGVKKHRENEAENIEAIHKMLVEQTYQPSAYKTFTIYEPKERLIFSLPYFPDRIIHHAIMNVLEPIFMAHFTADTYSSIKGRGIKKAADKLKLALRHDEPGTKYCLKFDVKKFYPSINHDILKSLLRRKFKDAQLLWLLDIIIDSAEGVPIGNYLSQFFANYYLSRLDHWVKEDLGIKYLYRYCDDIVILASTKSRLHTVFNQINGYLHKNLHLQIKGNYQVFPVAARGIDFVGYRFYHTHTLLRKSIKQNLARKAANGIRPESAASYNGWLKHADCINLKRKLLNGRI